MCLHENINSSMLHNITLVTSTDLIVSTCDIHSIIKHVTGLTAHMDRIIELCVHRTVLKAL
jgi:hypothetical protein